LQGRTGGRSVAFSSQLYLSCDHHLCMWLRVVRPGHLLIFILVASYSSSGGDAESNRLCVVVSLYIRTHTLLTTKKKIFAPIIGVVVVTRQFVTL
jgi:hypothetical protein